MKQPKKRIKAWNRKTGSLYTFFKRSKNCNFYSVSTKIGGSRWIIKSSSITFKKPLQKIDSLERSPRRTNSERMIGNQNARKHKIENETLTP